MSPLVRNAQSELEAANAHGAEVLDLVHAGLATAPQIEEAVKRRRRAQVDYLRAVRDSIGKPKGLMREEPFTRDLW